MAPSDDTTKLPSSLTIPYLKGLPDTGSIDKLSCKDDHEELKEYRRINGVQGVDDATLEDCESAAERLMHVRFWIIHASLHPNFGRVKNWLWVHERYRQQVTDITTQKEFNKYHSKIEKHSEFEDTQLFQFFIDEGIQVETLQILKNQHQDIETYDAIQNGFSKSDLGAVKTLLDSYRQELLDHLKLEEETLVAAWLQLSDEQYKKYRTYLSWKYCFMY